MKRTILFVAVVWFSLMLLYGVDAQPKEKQELLNPEERERLIKSLGSISETQKNTILKNWNRLEKKCQEAGFKITNFGFSAGERGIVEDTRVDFIAELTDKTVVSGSLTLDNAGAKTTIKMKRQLAPVQRNEFLDTLTRHVLLERRKFVLF